MEITIETLQNENAKLNERLSNAIAVFKKQKDELARLTAERDSYKTMAQEKTDTITELEQRLSETTENDQKFFDQLEEIDTLKNIQTNLTEENFNQSQLIQELRGQVNERIDDIKEMTNAIIKLAASCKKQADAAEKEGTK